MILTSRLRIEGFIVSEHMEVWPEALTELGTMVATGKLKYRETIADGLESAPRRFFGMLKGKNFGKQLVKLVRTTKQTGAPPKERARQSQDLKASVLKTI